MLPAEEPGNLKRNPHLFSRGRLGSRRVGESRYSLEICSRVMELMEGELRLKLPPPTFCALLFFKLAA